MKNKISVPRLLINFKNYKNSTGFNALKLANLIEKVSIQKNFVIGICVNALELKDVLRKVNIPVFLQHCDYNSFGAHTGAIVPELVKESLASGVLLNHIEKKLSEDVLIKTVQRCKSIGLKTLICVENIEMIKKILSFSPDMLLVEHFDSLGSCVSITEKMPDFIKERAELIGRDNFMIGAGISKGTHIKKALKMGAYGVIVSSSVVNAKSQKEKLIELVDAFI